ncbi:MAG: hypothetical protein H0W94_06055 [Actinobacteria bacterium]|nr:hypothetical protein [Actinomycetota bacterium]
MRIKRFAGATSAAVVLGLLGASQAVAAPASLTVTAFVEDQMCLNGDNVQVDLSATSESTSGVRYRWDFNNDGIFDTRFSRNPDASAVYPDEVNATAVVQARNRERDTATDSVSFATLRCEN